MNFSILQLEKTNYLDALMLQEGLFNAQLQKKAKGKATENYLILLQHQPVYTLGKSGDLNNLKIPIEQTDAEFFRTNRGGDITYHGPGQITGYPIFNLDTFNIGVKKYVELLEECIIECLKEFNIKGGRVEGASGVWLDSERDNPKKIAAIGIRVSRGITMHGFAFNVNTDLSYFENIIPCGIEDKAVTSIEKELGEKVNISKVEERLIESFNKYF